MTEPAAMESKPTVQTFGRRRLAPGGYGLDLAVMKSVPVKLNGHETTLAEAYCKIRDAQLRGVPSGPCLGPQKFETVESGIFVLDCDWSLLSTICSLFAMELEKINPFQVTWYYYDKDHSDMANEIQIFFAVHEGKIVRESHNFDCDEPMILQAYSEENPIWHNQQYFDEALAHYRYQQFYTETLTGKLMVLRPDEPLLYYYERSKTRDGLRELQTVLLAKVYRLLWVALPLLAALAYPPLRELMIITAILLFLNLMWVCWATRNVGDA